jgi:hypothetical protein
MRQERTRFECPHAGRIAGLNLGQHRAVFMGARTKDRHEASPETGLPVDGGKVQPAGPW